MKCNARLNPLAATPAFAAFELITAHAAGLAQYEVATPEGVLASAGYSARSEDASTLLKNPDGMSCLTRAQLQAGLRLTCGIVSLSPGSDTSIRRSWFSFFTLNMAREF